MGVLRNIGLAGNNPRLADCVTPASKPSAERSWVDRMYVDKGVEMMSDGTRGGDLDLLERMLLNNS